MHKEMYRGRQARKITWIGFWMNSLLTAFKLLAGILGNSGAMLADGVHSLSDFFTDIIVIIGFKITEKPEDDCHNYGHDKYETLATLVISIFLVVVGFELLRSGTVKIVAVMQGSILPRPGAIALAAAVISIAVKEVLYRCTLDVGKKINSSAVIANAWHHRSDSFSSIGVFLGIGGAFVLGERWTILDPIASIIVSLFIFKVAANIIRPAVEELVESSLKEEEVEKIKHTITNYRHVINFHKLKTRRIGTKAAIEFHLLLDANSDLFSAHEIATEIEYEIKTNFSGGCIVTIHLEPSNRDSEL